MKHRLNREAEKKNSSKIQNKNSYKKRTENEDLNKVDNLWPYDPLCQKDQTVPHKQEVI